MSYFVDFQYLITTRPHDIRQVLISDLHLSSDEPALAQAFSSLLDDLIALPQLKALYILGDWFDAWIGDDVYLSLNEQLKQSHWMTPFLQQLKQLRIQGCAVYVMHGNRDFLIGQPFCSQFGGTLIHEPYPLIIGDQRYRLEHGDALCTDDRAYQRFRKLMRNRLVQWYLLHKSLKKRLIIAEKMRQKSQKSNANKASYIMDVNQQAVTQAAIGFHGIVHGHTHRPAVHRIDSITGWVSEPTTLIDYAKQPDKLSTSTSASPLAHQAKQGIRYVLGDWRVLEATSSRPQVEAVIGVVVDNDPQSDINFSDNSTNAKKPSHLKGLTELLMVKFSC